MCRNSVCVGGSDLPFQTLFSTTFVALHVFTGHSNRTSWSDLPSELCVRGKKTQFVTSKTAVRNVFVLLQNKLVALIEFVAESRSAIC